MDKLEIKSYGEIEMPTRFDLIPSYAVCMETDTYPIREGTADGWFTIHDSTGEHIGNWYFRILDGFGREKLIHLNIPSLYEALKTRLLPYMPEGYTLQRCRVKSDFHPYMPVSPDKVTTFVI